MTMPNFSEPAPRVLSAAAVLTAARLDADHAAETNGRMAICRRCGTRTDGPSGSHLPSEQQLAQTEHWLDIRALATRIAGLASDRNT